MFSSKYIVLVIMFMFEKSVSSFNLINTSKRCDSKIRMEINFGPEYQYLAINAIPIAVALYILNGQNNYLKDTLATQDKIQRDALATQDKNQREILVMQDKNQKDSLANLEKILTMQDKNQRESLANLEKVLESQGRIQDEKWELRFKIFSDSLERNRRQDN